MPVRIRARLVRLPAVVVHASVGRMRVELEHSCEEVGRRERVKLAPVTVRHDLLHRLLLLR